MLRKTFFAVVFCWLAAPGLARANDVTQQFFDDIENKRSSEIVDRMAPHVAAQVDVPVIRVLAAAIRNHLGSVKQITTTGMNYKLTPKGRYSERSSRVVFEKGTANCQFATLNGEMVMFDIQSDQLVDWLTAPTETKEYEDLAHRALSEILAGDPVKAREMWHDAFRSVISLERLQEMKQLIHASVGETQAIQFKSITTDEGDTPNLRLHFDIKAERSSTTGSILIQFAGMKGHVLGFNVALPNN